MKYVENLKGNKLISVAIIVIGLLMSALIAFGTFDEFFIKKSFNKAFFYRAVGNCEAFIEYVALDKDKWLERCIKEKANDGSRGISDFEILKVNKENKTDKAFLQVQLTRSGDPYTVNYEMSSEGLKWKILNRIE